MDEKYDEMDMDIDMDEKDVIIEVNNKCKMLEGSLVHRLKYIEQQPQGIYVFPNIETEYHEECYTQHQIIMSNYLKEFGIYCLDDNYTPIKGDTFILNETEQGWNYNIFVFDCVNPLDTYQWFGYILRQHKKHKYFNIDVNLNNYFYINHAPKKQKVPDNVNDLLTYPNQEVFTMSAIEINNVGFFGGIIQVNFDVKHTTIPKSSKMIYCEIKPDSLKLLKTKIPENKHEWIGLRIKNNDNE
jgi:hypothetical protein